MAIIVLAVGFDLMEAYEATRQRHVEHLLAQIGEHFERVAWSAERLRAERTARLRELVGLAVRAVFLASRSARGRGPDDAGRG